MSKFQFAIRVEPEEGDPVEMLVESALPMNLEQLLGCVRDGRRKHFTQLAGRVRTLGGEVEGESRTFSGVIEFNEESPCFALVRGGVLPVVYLPRCTVILDSNAFIWLGVDNGMSHHDAGKWELALSFLNADRFTLNPMAVAFEGKSRETPSLEDFESILRDARERVSAKLPAAKFTEHSPTAIRALHEMRRSFDERAKRETAFLMEVAPQLKTGVRKEGLAKMEAAIHASAEKHGLEERNLVTLTALSLLYEGGQGLEGPDGGAARRVLLSKGPFTEGDAYNALADLRLIEMMACSQALSGEEFALLTGDLGVALLWCGFNCVQAQPTATGMTSNFRPQRGLFPKCPEERLSQLLGSPAKVEKQ